MDDLSLQLPNGDLISDCKWRLRTFVERDAYAGFDYAATCVTAADDVITADHVYAMYSVMRARSSRAAWNKFIGRPLPELGAIPTTLDLIDGSDEAVEVGLAALARLVEIISAQKWLTDMAASKVLFLKRPRFVGVSDSYVRNCLGISEWRLGERPETPAFYVARMLAVERGLRKLGQHNEAVLQALKSYADAMGSFVPTGGRFNGQRIPVQLSKVRILDILLWTEVAIHGVTPHPQWRPWYQSET